MKFSKEKKTSNIINFERLKNYEKKESIISSMHNFTRYNYLPIPITKSISTEKL